MKRFTDKTIFEPQRYYSVSEAAKILGVNRSTVWRWIKLMGLRGRTRIVNNRIEYVGSDLEKLLRHF